MAERTRPIRIEFCVTEQERRLIQNKMAQLGTRNMGAYLRKMAIDGYIIKVDYTQQKKLAAAVSRAASNINQICRRINSTGNLFGNVGTGKSYAAGCIANALIERMVSVLFVGLSDVVNRMQSNFGADRDAYLKMLMRPELLILDDLGAERNTSFGRERVFDVVNKRLLTGKPMIVTTNIPLSVMQKAADLDERRIYDRVLEVCVPIQFNGENFRKGNAAENVKRAAKILNQTN